MARAISALSLNEVFSWAMNEEGSRSMVSPWQGANTVRHRNSVNRVAYYLGGSLACSSALRVAMYQRYFLPRSNDCR